MPVQLSRNQLMAAGGAAVVLLIAGVYLGRVSTRRAADAAATQGAATEPAGAPAPGGPGAAPPAGAADAQPAQAGPRPGELTWVKPGLRLTYYTASARINGRHTELVLDENGEWEVVDTGEVRAEVEKDDRASGQAYAQVNVTDVSDGTAALEFRTYNIEVGTNAIALPNYGGWVGAVSASDLWKAPSELQQMREEKTKERKVQRYTPTINGRKYNAIRIHTQTGNGSTQYTYDLESGVLLLEGMSATGGADFKQRDGTTMKTAQGGTSLRMSRLVSVRQVNLPWSGMPAPDWVGSSPGLTYRGTFTVKVPSSPPNNLSVTIECPFASRGRGWAQCEQRDTVRTYMPNVPPQVSTTNRVFGTTQIGGPWIPPASFARLTPGVIDEDPVTRTRVEFLGIRGGHAMFAEKGARTSTEMAYDRQSGLLVERIDTQPVGPSTITVRVAVDRR